MGSSSSRPQIPPYAHVVPNTKSSGYSAVYRDPAHPDELVTSLLTEEFKNTWDCFLCGVRISGSAPALGVREGGAYTWKTYDQIRTTALEIGAGIMSENLVPEVEYPAEQYHAARKLRPLGIFAKNRVEWFVTELAAAAFGITIIPLYDTLGSEALIFILQQTKMETVFIAPECAASTLAIAADSNLKSVVAMAPLSDSISSKMRAAGLKIHEWSAILSAGQASQIKPTPPAPEVVNTICYTSGTTGTPKGVMLTHKNFCTLFAGGKRGMIGQTVLEMTPHDVHLSYLPLAHVLERVFANYVLFNGGRIGLYSGTSELIMEDVKALRPTFFLSVPRLFYRIDDRVTSTVRARSAFARHVFNNVIESRLKSLRQGGHPSPSSPVERKVLARVKNILGGRIRFLACAGAPIKAETLERMSVYFCCPVSNGFGMTETTGVAFMSRPYDHSFGHIGGILPTLEWKFKSFPDMEYDAEASPPSGEVLLKGPSLAEGYFLDPEQNAEAYTKDGWLRTGDIAKMEPSGAIRVVDRAKSMFKLSQGEYVSPERIEAVYCRALLVGQIWIYGDSTQSDLIAVIVPCELNAPDWAASNGLARDTEFKVLAENEQFVASLQSSMKAVEGELKGFERVKKFHVYTEPFSVDNGLLTPTMKLRRIQLRRAFQDEITKMYED